MHYEIAVLNDDNLSRTLPWDSSSRLGAHYTLTKVSFLQWTQQMYTQFQNLWIYLDRQ